MTERANVFELVHFGVEATPGSPATPNRRMSSMMVIPGPQVDISSYRASGYLYPTVSALNREWMEASVSGPINYNELIYPLASLLKYGSPSGSPAYTWTIDPESDSQDTIKTYTIDYGSSVRAMRMSYGLFTGVTLTFSRTGNNMTATILGQAVEDGITMLGTPTSVTETPVTPPQVSVKIADTQAGLAGATAMLRPIEVEWAMSNKYGPVWALNASTSYAAHVPLVPALSGRLVTQADAEGMGLLTNMRANSFKFMRITATGSSIGTVAPYSMEIDAAFKVTDVSEIRDEDGVSAIEWTFGGFHDSTWGAATAFSIVNELAAV
jgi:hypothetical protein